MPNCSWETLEIALVGAAGTPIMIERIIQLNNSLYLCEVRRGVAARSCSTRGLSERSSIDATQSPGIRTPGGRHHHLTLWRYWETLSPSPGFRKTYRCSWAIW